MLKRVENSSTSTNEAIRLKVIYPQVIRSNKEGQETKQKIIMFQKDRMCQIII